MLTLRYALPVIRSLIKYIRWLARSLTDSLRLVVVQKNALLDPRMQRCGRLHRSTRIDILELLKRSIKWSVSRSVNMECWLLSATGHCLIVELTRNCLLGLQPMQRAVWGETAQFYSQHWLMHCKKRKYIWKHNDILIESTWAEQSLTATRTKKAVVRVDVVSLASYI
jgi:hypothetical protein